MAQAGRDREQAAEVLTLSRTVLADTEQELARRIEQATASLATLTELQAALDLLEERHAQLAGAPTTGRRTTRPRRTRMPTRPRVRRRRTRTRSST